MPVPLNRSFWNSQFFSDIDLPQTLTLQCLDLSASRSSSNAGRMLSVHRLC